MRPVRLGWCLFLQNPKYFNKWDFPQNFMPGIYAWLLFDSFHCVYFVAVLVARRPDFGALRVLSASLPSIGTPYILTPSKTFLPILIKQKCCVRYLAVVSFLKITTDFFLPFPGECHKKKSNTGHCDKC